MGEQCPDAIITPERVVRCELPGGHDGDHHGGYETDTATISATWKTPAYDPQQDSCPF